MIIIRSWPLACASHGAMECASLLTHPPDRHGRCRHHPFPVAKKKQNGGEADWNKQNSSSPILWQSTDHVVHIHPVEDLPRVYFFDGQGFSENKTKQRGMLLLVESRSRYQIFCSLLRQLFVFFLSLFLFIHPSTVPVWAIFFPTKKKRDFWISVAKGAILFI